MKSNKSKIVLSGRGATITYGFISPAQYEKLLNSSVEMDDLFSLAGNQFVGYGVHPDEFQLYLDGERIADELDDITEHFPLTIFPEKDLIRFTSENKYALVMIEHEEGQWCEDTLQIDDPNQLVFELRRFELGDMFLSVISCKNLDEDLEQGDLDGASTVFYLASSEGDVRELNSDEA